MDVPLLEQTLTTCTPVNSQQHGCLFEYSSNWSAETEQKPTSLPNAQPGIFNAAAAEQVMFDHQTKGAVQGLYGADVKAPYARKRFRL